MNEMALSQSQVKGTGVEVCQSPDGKFYLRHSDGPKAAGNIYTSYDEQVTVDAEGFVACGSWASAKNVMLQDMFNAVIVEKRKETKPEPASEPTFDAEHQAGVEDAVERFRKKATKKKAVRKCSVRGCNGKHMSKGYCSKHYQQKKRRGEL